jgi:nitrogen fixation/metabolism regulation signal transduction histidine kinase
MYLFLLCGILVAVAFMLFIGKWILRPIERLIRYTEEIRDGNLDLVVKIDSDDEIGRLSEAFNDMTAGLRKFRRGAQAKLLRTQQATKEALNNFLDSIQALKFRHSLFLYLMNSSKTLFATDLLKKRRKKRKFFRNS